MLPFGLVVARQTDGGAKEFAGCHLRLVRDELNRAITRSAESMSHGLFLCERTDMSNCSRELGGIFCFGVSVVVDKPVQKGGWFIPFLSFRSEHGNHLGLDAFEASAPVGKAAFEVECLDCAIHCVVEG